MKTMKWKRYRFLTYSVDDYRPIVFNPEYPWWCSGEGEDSDGDYAVIVAYLPTNERIFDYWPDAFNIQFTEEESIVFTDRFPEPDYFKP